MKLLSGAINWIKGKLSEFKAGFEYARTGLVRGEVGAMSTSAIFQMGIGAFIVIMFVISFAEELETAIAGATGITNTFTLAILDVVAWALPVAILAGVIYAAFKVFKSR